MKLLAVVTTDYPLEAAEASALLLPAIDKSFNSISVDGEPSTNDCVILLANGASELERTAESDAAFATALDQVCASLARQVVEDGEGITVLAQINVTGAVDDAQAKAIARRVATSPLVKTAIAGEDANWGRVVMAVGKAGEPADRDRLSIWFGGIRVAHKGARDPGYDEATVSAAMKKPEISLKVALGMGKGRDRVLTCDLTKEYVAINGDYRS